MHVGVGELPAAARGPPDRGQQANFLVIADRVQAETDLGGHLAAGGNFIDTADVYGAGASEELLGQLIAETSSRDRLVLGTKFGVASVPGDPNSGGNGRKNMLTALDASLRRLRTDDVDVYWLHMWDAVTPADEVMSVFDALVRSGKIRARGAE